jgi:cardiolipin synthase
MTALEQGETLALVLVLAHVVLGFLATVAVSTNRRPSAAIAWVLAIIFIPFLGAIVYLFVGRNRLPARRRDQQRGMNAWFLENTSPRSLPPDASTTRSG